MGGVQIVAGAPPLPSAAGCRADVIKLPELGNETDWLI
jgi:hypothetical protein